MKKDIKFCWEEGWRICEELDERKKYNENLLYEHKNTFKKEKYVGNPMESNLSHFLI